MDREEAKAILAKELEGYRKRSYTELLYLLKTQDVRNVSGPSGKTYQLEFYAVWDDCEDGNLRVIGAIDDGGLRAFVPITDDFIITPDGKFIDDSM